MYAYPKKAAFGKSLPKKAIYEHGRPTRRVQQLFVDQIARIVWQYKLSPETTNLAAKPEVPEIQVFAITLKDGKLDETVLRCIDKAINFPIFFELTFEERVKEVAAYKRQNEADKSKWIVGDYFELEWSELSADRESLPVALDLARLYEQMLRRLMPIPARRSESLKDHTDRVGEIRNREKFCHKLESRLAKEKQFNRKVEINGELRKVRSKLENLVAEGYKK